MGKLIKLRKGKKGSFKFKSEKTLKPFRAIKGLLTVGIGLALFSSARQHL